MLGQVRPARLDWTFSAPGLPNAEYGSIYNIFDRRSSLVIKWSFTNQSADRAVVVPHDFRAKLRVSVAQGTKSSPIKSEWQQASHVTESAFIAVPLGLQVRLAPGESLALTGLLKEGLPAGE